MNGTSAPSWVPQPSTLRKGRPLPLPEYLLWVMVLPISQMDTEAPMVVGFVHGSHR